MNISVASSKFYCYHILKHNIVSNELNPFHIFEFHAQKDEGLKIGDYIQSDSGEFAYVDKIFPTKVRVWIHYQKEFKSNSSNKYSG